MDVKRAVAGAVVAATGVGVATPNLLAFDPSSPLEIVVTLLGVLLGAALFAAGVFLYRSDVSTPHALRVAGWNALGVAVLGLVVALALGYPGVSLPTPIAASILGVSAVAHVLIGVNDVRRIRADELASERKKLAVLNRLARHNLRNQAQVLTSSAEIVREHVTGDRGEKAADHVYDSARRIATINTKLGRFQEATEHRVAGETSDLQSLVGQAVEPYRESHPDASIDVSVPDVTVRASDHLSTAVDELLENAFEHGEAADRGVSVSATADGEWVELTVSDDGPGISDHEWEAVTGDRETSQLEHASGLGLWVVKAIVEGFDGRLERNDDGTAVTMSVPRA